MTVSLSGISQFAKCFVLHFILLVTAEAGTAGGVLGSSHLIVEATKAHREEETWLQGELELELRPLGSRVLLPAVVPAHPSTALLSPVRVLRNVPASTPSPGSHGAGGLAWEQQGSPQHRQLSWFARPSPLPIGCPGKASA